MRGGSCFVFHSAEGQICDAASLQRPNTDNYTVLMSLNTNHVFVTKADSPVHLLRTFC